MQEIFGDMAPGEPLGVKPASDPREGHLFEKEKQR